MAPQATDLGRSDPPAIVDKPRSKGLGFTCWVITRTWVDREVARIGRRRALECGDELRRLRSDAGLSLREAGATAGVDWSYIARIESAQAEPSLEVLTRLGLVYGADLAVRFYPNSGPRLHDRFQAPMVEALLRVLDRRWSPTPEVPIWTPVRGVVDLVLDDRMTPTTVASEFQSEIHRLEQQLRWNGEKAGALQMRLDRDRPDRRDVSTMLVLRSTAANREIARRFEATLAAAYPARYGDVVDSLMTSSGPWPGPSLLWVKVEAGQGSVLSTPPRGVRLGRSLARVVA